MTNTVRPQRVYGNSWAKLIEEQLACDIPAIDELEEDKERYDYNQSLIRWEAIYLRLRVLTFHHLAIDHDFGPLKEHARLGVESAVDYLWGDWREEAEVLPGKKLTKQECRAVLGWYDPLREGLTLTLLTDDLETAKRICEYPGPDAIQQDFDAGVTDHEFYLLLSRYLLGKSLELESASITKIVTGRGRRAKHLLKILLDIDREELKSLENSFKQYLAYFRKSEQNPDIFQEGISLNASILWNLARLRGMIVELPLEEDWDLVLTPESCGLANT